MTAIQVQVISPSHETCGPRTEEIEPFVDALPQLMVSEYRSGWLAMVLHPQTNRAFICCLYIDESYLQADLYDHCVQNVTDTVTLFNYLGLVVHPDKSILELTQRLVFLG